MQLHLKPSNDSPYPLGGILLQGPSAAAWIADIQRMGLSLADVAAYPLPGDTPNSVGGCLLECDLSQSRPDIGRHSLCRLAHGLLFLPERTVLYPAITSAEAEQLLLARKHLLHPAFGWVELPPAIDWAELIRPPEERPLAIRRPASSLFIPRQVKSFWVKSLPPQDILQQLEDQYTPQPEALDRRPLSPAEQVKLAVLKNLLAPSDGSSLLDKLREHPWVQRLQADLEQLLERNKQQVDRLMDLLHENPLEGLKYALPLDGEGTGRGGDTGPGRLELSKRWMDFSLGSQPSKGNSGGAALKEEAYDRLRNRYREIAQELIGQGDFQKAAFIYLKLLKSYHEAGNTLEQGGHYAEAAAVFIRYTNAKQRAAECYEKGNMILEAIEIYQELHQDEKVGDLYLRIGRREEANHYFQKVVDKYQQNRQYMEAALLCQGKMGNLAAAQELLLKGWREKKAAFQCLSQYFANIEDEKTCCEHLERIYAEEVDVANRALFLQVIKGEYPQRKGLTARMREMAHEIIVTEGLRNPGLLSDLSHFNPTDKQLGTDIVRYKLKGRT